MPTFKTKLEDIQGAVCASTYARLTKLIDSAHIDWLSLTVQDNEENLSFRYSDGCIKLDGLVNNAKINELCDLCEGKFSEVKA